MANQNDSFIDEVTEDLRRDRLFTAMRRYGWIGLLVILAIVAGAAWREYSRASAAREAAAFGDAVIAAEAAPEPAALLALDPGSRRGRKALLALLAAGQQVEAGQRDVAIATLRTVADDTATAQPERDLARIKLVLLGGADMEPAARDAMLADLSAAGRPFRLLALEQKAVALIEAGRPEDAVTLIRQIQQEQGVSDVQRRRLAETLITLGVADTPDDADAPPAAAPPAAAPPVTAPPAN